MPQPAPTFEIDFRGWQTYGQFGSNLGIIENQETGNCHLIFTTQDESEPGNHNYVAGPVKKVAEFGKQKTFAVYEGPGCRYFVDFYQAKVYRETENTLDLIKRSKPITQWKPTQKHYQEWVNKYKTSQGQRLETVRVIPPN